MRRADREITDFNQIIAIMNQCDCCRLGFVDSDSTYIVPLNFGYRKENNKLILYFHGAKTGKKIDLIKTNSCVGFEMDTRHQLVENEIACDYSYHYQSIIGKGNISFVEDETEKISALNCIMSHYSNKTEWEFQEQMVAHTTIYKIIVTEWSCKVH